MYEDVPKGDGPCVATNARGCLRIEAAQLVQCLADRSKVALNQLTYSSICHECLERGTGRVVGDVASRSMDIVQQS
jgi:hypothetical protein